MRKIGVVRSAAVTATAAQIIGPSNQRVAILFSPPATNGQSYTVSTDPNVTAGAGLSLTANSAPILISEELFGDAATKPWFAIANTSFSTGFLETIITE